MTQAIVATMPTADPVSDLPLPSIPRWKRLDVALLIAILTATYVVRVLCIDPAPSFDELWHMATTKGLGSPLSYYSYDVVHHNAMRQISLENAKPIWAMWTDMRGVLHPPFFLLALRLWREVIGESTFSSHLFSITWGAVGLAFLFATARMSMNRTVASVLTLAAGCAQTQVYLAQEIRPYAMLNAIGAIALWMMTRVVLLGPTRRRAIFLGLITLPIVMTHYFGFGAAVAIGLFGVSQLNGHRRAFLTTVAGCAAFFAIAWAPIALRQTRDFDVGDVLLKSPRDVVFETLMVAGAPFRLFAERDYQIELTPVFSGVLFLLPWLLIRRFRPLLPWALWLCCTLGCIVALDFARSTRHVAYIRYLAVASPAVPLLFAGVVWPIRRWLAYVVSATVLLTGAIYLISKNRVLLDAQDFQSIVDVIESRIRPEEAIVVYDVSPGTSWRPPVWIMTLSDSPKIFPRTMLMLTKPISPAQVDELGTRFIWLIANGSAPPNQVIPGGEVTRVFYAQEEIAIYRIKIGSPPSTGATTLPASMPAGS